MIVTLSEAKAHLRVTESADDSLITMYIEAAEEYVKNFLNRPNVPQTASIKAAMLLIIGGMYETREDKIVGQTVQINPSVMNLLYPYRDEIGI